MSSGAPGEEYGMWSAVGVTEFEERVYREALRHPGAGPERWAHGVGESEPRVRRALARLAELGLVELPRTPDRTDGADGTATEDPAEPAAGSSPSAASVRSADITALDPRVAIRDLIRRHERQFDLLTALAGGELAREYDEARLHTEPSRLLEVVVGGTEHSVRLRQLYAVAEHEVCVLDTAPYVVDPALHSAYESEAMRRGVAFRTVYAIGGLEDPERLAQARRMASFGERGRVLPAVPLKLVLVDGRTAMVPLTRPEYGAGASAALVHHSALTDALGAVFETLWRGAAPLGTTGSGVPSATASGELTGTEREILTLLAAGLSDVAITRQLGLSVRTLRRRIGDLQERLGANGRFQAGVLAARRGWI
ncbi:helix-turn-helix transcriptional regulator [Streptomyces sp. Z26]|uniref:helix-turn-helix transcriptional regulator n=1 Tax=Streptomyces sp. Z26 TaxID=2500177 RepID=UPI000EF1354B|nr:helix-turn-helix transcriptional regulator [Streptomyces sp. Z26]RLL67914.1 helix-turn-helix transcriptional regulator [Streptomyces sp. Z26]